LCDAKGEIEKKTKYCMKHLLERGDERHNNLKTIKSHLNNDTHTDIEMGERRG
jgi:hypothetical protein